MTDNKIWYAYSRHNDLTVTSVSPVRLEDFDSETQIEVEIDAELAISFIEKPHLMFEHAIYYCGGIPKIMNRDDMVPDERSYSIMRIRGEPEGPSSGLEMVIDRSKQTLTISFPKEFFSYLGTVINALFSESGIMYLYVTDRGNPNNLIDCIKVDMHKLANEQMLELSYTYDPDVTDLYTREIFKTYKLEIK